MAGMRAATVIALALLALCAPAAGGAARCSGTTNTQLGATRVLTASGMGCSAAKSVVKTHAVHAGPSAFKRNGRYELGDYRCVTYEKRGSSYRARCTRGKRLFKLSYKTP